ncbi:MAG: hydrogenase, partial [Victivallales bacterium]
MNTSFLVLKNCTAAPLASLPCPEFSEFRKTLIQAVAEKKMRVSSFFALQEKEGHKLIAVLADDASSTLCLTSSAIGSSYESLTKDCPQFHWFEREIAEQYGI